MNNAYLYDHVRTPRGKGRPDGKLHEITPIQLATQMLQTLRERSLFDTGQVDDVILGCVSPIGEQGCNIARIAALLVSRSTAFVPRGWSRSTSVLRC
jgi:acetyl-CoA C-acetyltransferase